MPKFEFAAYTERTLYEVEASTEAEARAKLWDDPTEYATGRHGDTLDGPQSYELIDVTTGDDRADGAA